MKALTEEFDLKHELVEKSLEAYVLALETINRITIKYRLESFCYLLCNAWELLLKARILDLEKHEGSIYYEQSEGQKKRSLSLKDCLKKVMPNQNDPVRRNVERIEDLRDEAVHLVISHIPVDFLSLFQAGVINFHKLSRSWFGMSLAEKYPVGMLSIAYDVDPEKSDIGNASLKSKLGKDAVSFLSQYCAEIRNELDQLQRTPEFAIGIEYKLALTKKADEADIVLAQGSTDGAFTQIVEVAKDSSSTHPYRQKEVIAQCLEKGLPVNQYDIQCMAVVHGIKSRPEFFYQGKIPGSPGQYSQSFIEWMAVWYQQDREFFQKARQLRANKKEKQ